MFFPNFFVYLHKNRKYMRKTSLLRKSDVSGERIVAAFLDKNVYSKFDDFERINDKQRQVAGIDTKFTFNERDGS